MYFCFLYPLVELDTEFFSPKNVVLSFFFYSTFTWLSSSEVKNAMSLKPIQKKLSASFLSLKQWSALSISPFLKNVFLEMCIALS